MKIFLVIIFSSVLFSNSNKANSLRPTFLTWDQINKDVSIIYGQLRQSKDKEITKKLVDGRKDAFIKDLGNYINNFNTTLWTQNSLPYIKYYYIKVPANISKFQGFDLDKLHGSSPQKLISFIYYFDVIRDKIWTHQIRAEKKKLINGLKSFRNMFSKQ